VETVWEEKTPTGEPCSTTGTHTWAIEEGRWRRIRLPKTGAETSRLFNAGDYAATVSAAEKWLTVDPYSVGAYSQLIAAIERSGQEALEPKRMDALRAMGSVNPRDSDAQFRAISAAKDGGVATVLFQRMAKDDCSFAGAAANVSLKLSPREALAFLTKVGTATPRLKLEAVRVLTSLGAKRALSDMLNSETLDALRRELDGSRDGAWAGDRAAVVGKALLLIGNKAAARDWAAYSVTRDANGSAVAGLLRRLH
jgi:hypothetical protein